MKLLLIFFSILFASSCATPVADEIDYRAPSQNNYSTSTSFNQPFDEVWNAVIDYATESFFAISSYEKASGLMTLSFSATPERFVNCGEWIVNGTAHNYVQFQRLLPDTDVVLAGVMNIRVSEREEGITTVVSNARYVLNITSSHTRLDLNFNQIPFTISDTWAFDSASADTIAVTNPAVGTAPSRTCAPTGVAERETLNGIAALLSRS